MKPTCEVSSKIKLHCQGCGLAFYIELISEPIAFEERAIELQIRSAVDTLTKTNCPHCEEKTKQIHFFTDYGMPIEPIKRKKKK